MKPVDIVIIVIIAAVIGLAGWYVYRAKKSGKKCIGCPDGCACSGKSEGCSCGDGGSSCGCGGNK